MGRAQQGNVAIILGLALMPIMLAVGAAVDYSRATVLLTSLQAGTDATVLSLCQASPTIAKADLKRTARAFIQEYLGSNGTVAIDALQITNSPRVVTLTASSSLDTAFMKIVNQNTLEVKVTAGCQVSENYYEIALVLDTTGSMSSSAGSGQPSKLDSAKTAAKTFIDYMHSTGALPGHVRMALASFSSIPVRLTNIRFSFTRIG